MNALKGIGGAMRGNTSFTPRGIARASCVTQTVYAKTIICPVLYNHMKCGAVFSQHTALHVMYHGTHLCWHDN